MVDCGATKYALVQLCTGQKFAYTGSHADFLKDLSTTDNKGLIVRHCSQVHGYIICRELDEAGLAWW